MEHKLISGGEIYLPFARSRIKALRAAGLKYASQQFEIDGCSVKVRIEPGHEYISLSGVPLNVLLVFRTRNTTGDMHNETYDYLIYGTRAPELTKFVFLGKLQAKESQVTSMFNGNPIVDSYDRVRYSFLGAYGRDVLVLKEHSTNALTGDGTRYSWGRPSTTISDYQLLLGETELRAAQNIATDTRRQYYFWMKTWHKSEFPVEWHEGFSPPTEFGGMPTDTWYVTMYASGPVGVVTVQMNGSLIPGFPAWNMVVGNVSSSTLTRTSPAPTARAVFPPVVVATTETGVSWDQIDLDIKGKVGMRRKSDMSLVPHATTPVTIPLPDLDPGSVRRELLDFPHRAVTFGLDRVRACCKAGFYSTDPDNATWYTTYSDALQPMPAPPLAPYGFGDRVNADAQDPRKIVYFDDFMVKAIWSDAYGVPANPNPAKGGLILVSYSRPTGKEISAVAQTEVPLDSHSFAPLSDPDTRFKRVTIPDLPKGAYFVTMLRDELTCM